MKATLPLLLILMAGGAQAQFGALDPTFGNGGVVQTEIEQPSVGNAMEVQPDGRILVGGNADSTSVIVRYMSDGSLDTTFGTNGAVVYAPVAGPGGREFTITEILVLGNGKILVAGRSTYYLSSALQQIHVSRFNSNGSIDTNFGGNGTGRLSISLSSQENGAAWEMLMQPDGKILLQATRTAVTTGSLTYRLLANGTYDGSFGSGGEALWAWVNYSHTHGRCIALEPDGKVLVGGWLASPTESDRFVRRLTAQGELDATYGTGGLVLLDEGDGYTEMVSDILLQSDGKLLVIGSVSTPAEQRFRVTRLLSDGTIDTSYGTNGNAMGPIVSGTIEPRRGRLQADGKLAFATNSTVGSVTRSSIWRLDANGQLDTSFGIDGQLVDPFGTGTSKTHHVAQQSDGKLLICGQGLGSDVLTAARLTSGQLVGVTEVGKQASMILYPNPANDNVTLRTEETFDRVEILDAQGRVLTTMLHTRGAVDLGTQLLPAGNYFVRTNSGGKSSTLPLIKQTP
ncbi:MAG: T9SS type A sorting domain-containing protein [Flavobacteriales bacterium]|nr:T9SS type A sorting domain-containing protein [Flavobacteriales bacterium]